MKSKPQASNGSSTRTGAGTLEDAATTTPAEALSRKVFEKELKNLHIELVHLQEWVKHAGLKVCIVFEGRDSAGKGGVIKAITERVSHRVFREVALPAPTDREKTQMYVQRYIPHLPAAGEVVLFDRSWYNRAGVERVMGFCTEDEAKNFLEAVPRIERSIVDSGCILLKYWLEVSEAEQSRRLRDRVNDGRKTWKLSPMDLQSYSRWYDYSRARDEMLAMTDTEWAPWHIARADDKWRMRLNVISHILASVPHQKLPQNKVKFPQRQERGDYREPDHPYRFIPERF
jgi:polyphosphate kinase